MIVGADGFAQRQNAQAVGVVGKAIGHGLANRLGHTGRCVEIGLAHLKVNNVDTPGLQLDGLLQNIHYDKRRQLLGALGRLGFAPRRLIHDSPWLTAPGGSGAGI